MAKTDITSNVEVANMEYRKTYYIYEFIIEIIQSVDTDTPIAIHIVDDNESLIKNDTSVILTVNTLDEIVVILNDFKKSFDEVKKLYTKGKIK